MCIILESFDSISQGIVCWIHDLYHFFYFTLRYASLVHFVGFRLFWPDINPHLGTFWAITVVPPSYMPVGQRKDDDLLARAHHGKTVMATTVRGHLLTSSFFTFIQLCGWEGLSSCIWRHFRLRVRHSHYSSYHSSLISFEFF